jgi:hypothetical protein
MLFNLNPHTLIGQLKMTQIHDTVADPVPSEGKGTFFYMQRRSQTDTKTNRGGASQQVHSRHGSAGRIWTGPISDTDLRGALA